jgi:hypothetical protein
MSRRPVPGTQSHTPKSTLSKADTSSTDIPWDPPTGVVKRSDGRFEIGGNHLGAWDRTWGAWGRMKVMTELPSCFSEAKRQSLLHRCRPVRI